MIGRPHITVALADGRRLDANHVSICRIAGDAFGIVLMCSGRAVIEPAEKIVSMAYAASGATHCSECGAPIQGGCL